jgi:hypothetical protein
VQVHRDEGVANRIDPESCADTREGIGEALTGERIGQPLSRESTLIRLIRLLRYLSCPFGCDMAIKRVNHPAKMTNSVREP